MNVKVEFSRRKIEELSKLDGNPRKITADEMECLKESLTSIPEYMEAHPIVLSDRTGELVIIDGNQRMEAARQLGWVDVPTALMSGLTEEKEKEIIIRANVNNGEWDEELLAEWDAALLDDWGVDISALSEKDFSSTGEEKDSGIAGVIPFTEVLGEEHNYIVLYFDNDVDWLQAQSVFDIQPVRTLSTRKDGVFKNKGFADKVGLGRVLNGAKALNKILGQDENIG